MPARPLSIIGSIIASEPASARNTDSASSAVEDDFAWQLSDARSQASTFHLKTTRPKLLGGIIASRPDSSRNTDSTSSAVDDELAWQLSDASSQATTFHLKTTSPKQFGGIISSEPGSSRNTDSTSCAVEDAFAWQLSDASNQATTAHFETTRPKLPDHRQQRRRMSCPVDTVDRLLEEKLESVAANASHSGAAAAPNKSISFCGEADLAKKPSLQTRRSLQSLLSEEAGNRSCLKLPQRRAAKTRGGSQQRLPSRDDPGSFGSDPEEGDSSREPSKGRKSTNSDLLSVRSEDPKLSEALSQSRPESPRHVKNWSPREAELPSHRRHRRGSCPVGGLSDDALRVVSLSPRLPTEAEPEKRRPRPHMIRGRRSSDTAVELVHGLEPSPPPPQATADRQNGRRATCTGVTDAAQSFMPSWGPDHFRAETFHQFKTYVVNSEIVLTPSGKPPSEPDPAIEILNATMASGKSVLFFDNDARYSQEALAAKLQERGVKIKVPSEPIREDFTDQRLSSTSTKSSDAPATTRCPSPYPNVISTGRTVAAYLKSFGIKRPFVMTSHAGLLEDFRAAGITNYIATIDDAGKPDEAYLKPLTERRIQSLIYGDVDTVILGCDRDLTPLKVAVATVYVQTIVANTSTFNQTAPLVNCCSSEAKRRFKAISLGAACQLVGAGFDPDLVGFDIRMPSQISAMVFTHPADHGGYGVDVQEALMVGKSHEKDIKFANDLGMKSLLISSSVATRVELSDRNNSFQRPTWILKDIAEIV